MTTEHQPVAGEPPIHRARYSLAIHEGARDDCRLCDIHDAGSQAPAPLGVLAGREQRRRATANILARIDRSKRILEDEATLLRTLVTAEQADADQACEQLAARNGTRTASDVLVQHDVTRKALCDALDAGYHLNWQQIIDTAQRHHDANTAWQDEAEQRRLALSEALSLGTSAPWDAITERARAARRGEAEAVRARQAAEFAMQSTAADALAHGGCHRKLMWQCQRAERAEAEARRNRDAWRNARRRAALMTAEVTRRAPLLGQYAERAEKAEAELARIRGGLYRQIRAAANATVGGDTYDRPARAVRDFARDLETRLPEDTASAVRQGPTCGEPGWAEQERARMERLYTAAYSRAERAEALGRKNFQRASRAEISLRAHQTAITEATERAERAEATLTRVRNMPRLCGDCQINLRAFLDAEQQAPAGALGDPQPATAADDADRIVAHRSQLSGGLFCLRCAPLHSTTPLTSDDLPDGGICCACGIDVLIDPDVREQPTTTGAIFTLPGGIKPAEREQPAVCCVCGYPNVTYRNCNEQPFCCRCAACCEPPVPCAHGCQPPTCTAQNTEMPDRVARCDLPAHHDEDHRDSTVPGILRWTDDVAVYPTSEVREQPTEPDGAALWATIRDHAARDHKFWTNLNSHHDQLYRRGVRL